MAKADGPTYVSDFRFKGYVNDFMVSPRNPITQQSSQQMAGIMIQDVGSSYQYPQQAKQPPTQSAEHRARKHEADLDIASFKQEKLQEMIDAEQAKKQDFEQMQLDRPYGKPGAGAPIYQNDHKRHKLTRFHTEIGLPQQPAPADRQPVYAARHSDNAGRQQHMPELQPQIPPPKSAEPHFKVEQLGNSSVDRALNDTQRRIEILKKEMQRLEEANVNSIQYIDPINGHLDRQVPLHAPFSFYDPWGKGQGNPRRKADGNLQGYPAIKEPGIVPTSREVSQSWPKHNGNPAVAESTGTGLNVESKFGGSGEPVKTYSGSNRTRFPTTMRKDIYGNTNMTEMDGYNPFKGKAPGNPEFFPYGKPGGGAPMRDDKGKYNLQRRNVDFAHERDSSAEISKKKNGANQYLHELQREMAEQRRARNEANIDLRAPIGELATIVQQGKVGFPKRDPNTGAILNHHHQTSDVTRAQNGIPERQKFAGVGEGDLNSSLHAKQYHNELSKIADERHRMRQLEKVRDTQEELKHGETWNELWGRPGAGAPNSKDLVFKKPKFNNVLYNPEIRDGLVVIKNTPQGIHQLDPDYYAKSTIHSNHVNMFELPIDKPRRERQANYRPTAPFATGVQLK